jgi:hypothetical protein
MLVAAARSLGDWPDGGLGNLEGTGAVCAGIVDADVPVDIAGGMSKSKWNGMPELVATDI